MGQVTRPAKGGKLVKIFPRQGGNVVKISAQKGGKEVITDIEPAPHPLPAAEAPVRDGPRRPPRAGPAPLARAEPEPPAARGVPAARPEQVLAPPLRQGDESRRERQRVPDAREIVIGRVDLPRDVHSGYSWWRRAPVQAKRRVPNSRSRKLYLASGSSSYTPGSILKVDGARILS